MLSAKSIQLIENFDDKRTIDKEMKFEVDSIENVYHLCQGNSPLLLVYFLSPSSLLSIPYARISSISTGSLSSDCDRYGHSHVI
jgi:hypothetical protein